MSQNTYYENKKKEIEDYIDEISSVKIDVKIRLFS
jgi:hypothetical protein